MKEQEGSLIFKIEEYKSNLAGLVEKEGELAATLKSNVANLENVNLFERGLVENFFLKFFFGQQVPKLLTFPSQQISLSVL